MTVTTPATFSFDVEGRGETTATVYRAREPREITLVLAHGAGAPQSHPFMTEFAARLARRGLDVVTFDFLYAARGKKLPDGSAALEACWHAAIAAVRARAGLGARALFLGGKSMGGRIASQVVADLALAGDAEDARPRIAGLVFLGYPLHPPKNPEARRAAHLRGIPCPMLFVQGSRDPFGGATEILALVEDLPGAEVHLVTEGDHSLGVPKRRGAEAQERELDAAAGRVVDFADRHAGTRAGAGRAGS